MKKTLTIILLLISLQTFSQKKNDYLPINLNKEYNFKWLGKKTKVSFKDSIQISGKTYFIYNKNNELNNIDELISISNYSVFFYSDFHKKHMLKFCFNSKIGEKVGFGRIISRNKTFKTPKGKIYINLIVVELEFGNSKSYEYYKKGIGLTI